MVVVAGRLESEVQEFILEIRANQTAFVKAWVSLALAQHHNPNIIREVLDECGLAYPADTTHLAGASLVWPMNMHVASDGITPRNLSGRVLTREGARAVKSLTWRKEKGYPLGMRGNQEVTDNTIFVAILRGRCYKMVWDGAEVGAAQPFTV